VDRGALGPLSAAFLGARAAAATHSLDDVALEDALRAAAEAGAAAWPGVALAPAAFARHLAARLPPAGDLLAGIAALRAADLYLACACAEGNAAAIAAFDRDFLAQVPSYVATVDPSPAFGDEVRQGLRERLLVPEPGRAPRIAEYAGRGALGGWLRVAAMRVALNLRRADRPGPQDDDVVAAAAAARLDPELDLLKARYKREFEEALRAAFASLTAEQRAILRLSLVEGLALEAIGALYRVHLSTISRRLARAREAVAAEAHRLLRERLRLTPSELASLEGLVRSQLDVSLGSLLRERSGESF
jgi:RNA polymerase sigma-70 factor (ECF subfamily)